MNDISTAVGILKQVIQSGLVCSSGDKIVTTCGLQGRRSSSSQHLPLALPICITRHVRNSSNRRIAAEFGFKSSDIYLWIGMLLQGSSLDDDSEAELWFSRGHRKSSSVLAWLQLSDFFSHLKMFNLCITAALQGLGLVAASTPNSFRLRLYLHVSESHSNLGNTSEAIRFLNVAIQDFHASVMRSRKRMSNAGSAVDSDVAALTEAFERCQLYIPLLPVPSRLFASVSHSLHPELCQITVLNPD